jgi:Phage integrase SAM-like domain
MRIYKRGSTYWFELVYEGQRIQKSTRVKSARAAGDIASAFRTALAKGDVGITARKRATNFGKAMEEFLTWSNEEHRSHPNTAERYRYSSAALLRYFRDLPLDQITPESVERFKLTRASQNGSHTKRRLRPATVNRELACLKALFNYAIKGNANLHNPVTRVGFLDEDNQQTRVVTYAEQRLSQSRFPNAT